MCSQVSNSPICIKDNSERSNGTGVMSRNPPCIKGPFQEVQFIYIRIVSTDLFSVEGAFREIYNVYKRSLPCSTVRI